MIDMSKEAIQKRHDAAYEKLSRDTANPRLVSYLFQAYLGDIYHAEFEEHYNQHHTCPQCEKQLDLPTCSCGCVRSKREWVWRHFVGRGANSVCDGEYLLWKMLEDSLGTIMRSGQ